MMLLSSDYFLSFFSDSSFLLYNRNCLHLIRSRTIDFWIMAHNRDGDLAYFLPDLLVLVQCFEYTTVFVGDSWPDP